MMTPFRSSTAISVVTELMMERVKARLVDHLDKLLHKPMTTLLTERYNRLMSFGAYDEPRVVHEMRVAS